MAKQKQQNQDVNTFSRGLYTNASYVAQPPGTYTYALNAIHETDKGDEGFRSNEQSNEYCCALPDYYSPIGDVYIGDGITIIFSVSKDETLSEIGMMDDNCNYETIVNADLGFQLNNQISATYRLRRGCERTIYFTIPTPMIFNLDGLDDFKTNGQWDKDKFKLAKVYKSIPEFESITLLESGALESGSYNASIQYLDNDLNPTEWITTCEPIKIYLFSTAKEYNAIRGTTNRTTDTENFGITNKAIKFNFKNFDPSYPFYRVAIIEATSGTGEVTAVRFSAPISTSVTSFEYSGLSSIQTQGTEEEVLAFNNVIAEAEYVEQIENRLVLGKTKGTQIDFCSLQKYASRIKSEMYQENVELNTISDSNPKTATVNFDGAGYMPGEIYSFGIVWIFDDSTLSPVYHIPGKATDNTTEDGMSNDNTCTTSYYTDNSESCEDYWGNDSDGNPLKNEPIRHHRFKSRGELGIPLYIEDSNPTNTVKYTLYLNLSGTIDETYVGDTVEYTVNYELLGVSKTYTNTFNVATFSPSEVLIDSNIGAIFTNIEVLENGVVVTDPNPSGVVYTTHIDDQLVTRDGTQYQSTMFGIKFSGIEPPTQEDTGGVNVIGYYIVRNERDEDNKTILDSGVLAPLLEEEEYVTHGHLAPNLSDNTKIKPDVFALIHPEHKFKTREYKNTNRIQQEGVFTVVSQVKNTVITQDVSSGSSYDPETSRNRDKDTDGFDLHTLTRDSKVEFSMDNQEFASSTELEEVFYLDALNSKSVQGTDALKKDVFNVSGDNRIGIVQLNVDKDRDDVDKKFPYVTLHRDLGNPYGNFRVLPYFMESKLPTYFSDNPDPILSGESKNIMNGDSYITPMRYHSALFVDDKCRLRKTKSGVFNIILGVLATIVGVAVAVFSGGTAIAAGVAIAGLGLSQISSGIKKVQVGKVYKDLYAAGLRDCIDDDDIDTYFGSNPEDDEFQWLSDTVTNLWFESGINMALRNGVTIALPDFLDAPAEQAQEGTSTPSNPAGSPENALDRYILEKLTVLDAENQNGRLYQGYAFGELYFLNDDYIRTNKQKAFFTLGLEYDCCSACKEDFPHRNVYSEQSFQEELTDNFRTFLPNNYRDIEGEKGVITGLFRIQNNLYIHTEEALWHLPQNLQERVTGDIVSFIGTGSFFDVPPRKVTDSDKASGGTSHDVATIKTASGVLFISENDRKVYLFDGNSLSPISDTGNQKWFNRNLEIIANKDFYNSSGFRYPYDNNPVNHFGTGFLSTYDSMNERLIITKKDFILSDRVLNETDYNICSLDGDMIIFDDYQLTIDNYLANGWNYDGIVYCEMKFSKTTYTGADPIIDVEYVSGVIVQDPVKYDKSWTMSYSLKDKSWISWHSYLPNYYLYTPNKFYSWKFGQFAFWKHNAENHYQTYYSIKYPHIIEYVRATPLDCNMAEYATVDTEARVWSDKYQNYSEDRYITFNKLIAYNSEQCTGLLTVTPKRSVEDYLFVQVANDVDEILINKGEVNWSFNDLRDYRSDYSIPIFRRDDLSLSSEYYTDKVLNLDAIDPNKDWQELQSFRDNYLVLRLIFDNFDNIRLITNYTRLDETKSY